MAHVETVTIHRSNMEKETMAVYVEMKPAGNVRVDVPIPKDFYNCLMRMAQNGADLHEQQMRAQILADGSKTVKS